MKTTRLARIVVPLVFLFALPIASSSAAVCPQRGQFFVKNNADKQYVNGTKNTIELRGRVLPRYDNCFTLTLSTAHINMNSGGTIDTDDFIEIGWRKYHLSDDTTYFRIFTEKCSPTGGCTVNEFTMPSTNIVGNYDEWKIVNELRTFDGRWSWSLEVDFFDGQGFRDYGQMLTSWENGAAYGETEAFGDGSGMHDDQRSLKHKNDSGSWVDWRGQTCDPNFNDGGYKYNKTSTTSYLIEEGSNSAC